MSTLKRITCAETHVGEGEHLTLAEIEQFASRCREAGVPGTATVRPAFDPFSRQVVSPLHLRLEWTEDL